MPTDYTALDAAILERLADGPQPFHTLAIVLAPVAKPFAKVDLLGHSTEWRVIDRRLQALRKSGKIKPHRTQGWSLT